MFKGPIASATLRTSAVLGLRLIVQAGTLLLVARMLGPEQFGGFVGVAALAVMLGTLSTFGTHLVLLGEVAKEAGRREQVLPYAIPCTLLCGSLLLVVYLLVAVNVLSTAGLSLSVLLLIGFAETLLQPLYALMTSEHHALGHIARAQLLQLLPMALRLVIAGIVVVLQLSHPLGAYTLGYAVASMVALAYGASLLPARWPSWRHWRLPDKQEWRGAFGYAAINITRSGPAELDKALALKLLPPGIAGVYAAAARVIGAITLPVAAMMLSALPRLFREGSDSQGTARLLGWMYAVALGYSLLLAGALWLLAPIFNPVFGEQYQGVAEMIRWLCPAIPGMALRLVAGNALMALGKSWMRVGFEVTGLVVLVIAGVALVGWLGSVGLPLALACAEWTMAIVGSGMIVYVRSIQGAYAESQKNKLKGCLKP